MICPKCKSEMSQNGADQICSRCDHRVAGPEPDAEDRLDLLVQQASRPSLGDLIRKAKGQGLITAQHEYGSTT